MLYSLCERKPLSIGLRYILEWILPTSLSSIPAEGNKRNKKFLNWCKISERHGTWNEVSLSQ